MKLSILIRCSDDWRVIKCIDSIDISCQIVVAMTPNSEIQAELEERKIPYALSLKGNPSMTTLTGLELCQYHNLLLIDCDCVFLPGAIQRIYNLAESADIVRPNIEFEAANFSSYLTRLARNFQYTYFDFIYEPGLFLKLNRVLPLVGGYLFTPFAPFTPDGELDFRLRQPGTRDELKIVTDSEPTIIHAALPFSKHLYAYWRYGQSEASRMFYLHQPVLLHIFLGMPYRHRSAWFYQYPFPTGVLIAICDCVYIISILLNLLMFKINLKLP
jgi:hypothetical protein